MNELMTAWTMRRVARRLREPVEREPGRRPGLDPARVEGVDRQDDQREVEEREDDRRREPQERSSWPRDSVIAPASQRLEGAEAPGDQQVDVMIAIGSSE